jgi:phosphomannomutase/phosphoglucomutase
MTLTINPKIFREYDIRGTVDVDLSTDFAYLLGRAYAQLAKENGVKLVAIGHDCRLTSDAYAKALIRGLNDDQIETVETGMGPTPQLYFAVYNSNLGGGIQVTGSHNPSNMNGFKICLGKKTLSGKEIQDLYHRMVKIAASNTAPAVGKAHSFKRPTQQEYVKYMVDNCSPFVGKRKLKIVVDAGNGVGGLVGPTVLRALGAEVIELFCDPDGRFPNHHPDPTELKNIETLIAKVKSTNADLGIGFDGDADRIGVVDEKGNPIFGDMLVLIFAREILKTVPGSTFVADVKCSSKLFADLKKRGANPIMWKTGHSLIKNKLVETGAQLAGEMSGHIFFKHRYFGFDDAIYSAARLVEIMSNTTVAASELLSDLHNTVSTPEIRVDCEEERKFKIADAAKNAFKEYQVSTIDGVRIDFEHGWGLVRASNTQPVLVMRFEADSEKNLKHYQQLVTDRIKQIERSL